MSDNFTLYLMLVAALAIGFLLGRRELRRPRGGSASGDTGSAVVSLHQLVEEHRNLDIDTFVETMIDHDDGVDMRLALGTLVRRRGEVEKAIGIHQSLLARPALTETQRTRSELELARDYMAAGLLGRAENLLAELALREGPARLEAQRALLEIYQREREWAQAVAVGREIARHDRSVRSQLAHFQCELAEEALERGDLRQARQALGRGSAFDPGCVRVKLTGAQLELASGRYREARRLLERAVRDDPDCAPLAVAPYREACRHLNDPAGFTAFLERCLRLGPYLPVIEALAAQLSDAAEGSAVSAFVMEQLLRNPTLGGFVALLEHLHRDGRPLAPEQVELVLHFSRSLLNRQPIYRCRNCGFPSRSVMWQCPSCHEWGSCKPVVRGDQLV